MVMAGIENEFDSFSEAVRRLAERMGPCVLCPRRCKVYRSKGQVGFCGIGAAAVVSSVGPHFGEESELVGTGGSGTIFFAGCNLGCVFCQNCDISHHRRGAEISVEELAGCMLELQGRGCHNVNFVTPTHVAAHVAASIELARERGLTIPAVYNTGGYDSVETLRLLEGFIDIYMPDMKYADGDVAGELSTAPDYPEINRAAVIEMHRQVGDLQTEDGVAYRGLLVRHLVLPNNLAGSIETIEFLAEEVSRNTAINVMAQYHPCYKAKNHAKINRRPTSEEFNAAQRYAADKALNVLA